MLGVVLTVVAVAVCVISSIFVFSAQGYLPATKSFDPTWWSTLGFFTGIAAAVMLCWRHKWPELVLGIALVPPLCFRSDALAALVALAALAAHRRDRLMWIGSVLVYFATAWALFGDANRHPDVTIAGQIVGKQFSAVQLMGTLTVAVVMTAVPLTVGVVRGMQDTLAIREAKEEELRAEMTRRAERTRIAREMHDVLGHRLSLLSLQAGALEVGKGPATTEAAKTVRTTARQSLEDLRQVIGVLRDGQGFGENGESGTHPEPPQPTLADIPELVANARRAGLGVNVTILLDDAGGAPALLGTTAYRIVQESLTNILKHAPGAAAEVSVRGGPGSGVTVEVVNPLPATPTAGKPPGAGAGLTGIGERVTLIGGNVSAGPTEERTFAVRAWLPWGHH
ncbi:two-component sensor histidine kinase [Amycolatopsis alba DSM 44262]|uniref:histidine kinase n=1 Tax=Amycolatopsis alba DSM 44262 TaxID=1125972 RepID=A0A229S484_AMYAL|nr:two-component sensor histidine kinase [Amycolatopsis alba DSM 44262]